VAIKNQLSSEERSILLRLARQAITEIASGRATPPLDMSTLPATLQEWGASFVTLTRRDQLRGCIGTLEPHQPLALDVQEHACAAACSDFRFPPVRADELQEIQIEISRLSIPVDLNYASPQDLLTKLKPGVDGVTLIDGWQRATFLPQVWEKIPDPVDFLSHLCYKMGASPDLWREKKIKVQVYQVEEFHE